ncbi:MAG: hypothetical protein QG586_1535 [Pseudomonadota bacterium]|jgi:hypothetical protein|nr:hypothetical protein [Pseudomonadota bacterium]
MRVLPFACVIAVLGPAVAQADPDRCREVYQARTFFGYACDADCVLHKAGFAWAERHGITTPTTCAAIDAELLAGCSAYAAEGLSPFDAGYGWALENEIADPALCTGAGAAFERGCRQYVDESPSPKVNRCAEAWPGHVEAFPARISGR